MKKADQKLKGGQILRVFPVLVPSLKLTAKAPVLLDAWKRRFLLETTICRGYVSFRECNCNCLVDVGSMDRETCFFLQGGLCVCVCVFVSQNLRGGRF